MRKRRKRPSSTPVQTNPAHLSIGDFLFLEEWLNQKAGESGFIKRKSRKIHPRNLLASLVEESLRGSPPCSTASPTRWRHKGCKCSTPHMKMAASVPGSPPVKIGSSPLSASTRRCVSRLASVVRAFIGGSRFASVLSADPTAPAALDCSAAPGARAPRSSAIGPSTRDSLLHSQPRSRAGRRVDVDDG